MRTKGCNCLLHNSSHAFTLEQLETKISCPLNHFGEPILTCPNQGAIPEPEKPEAHTQAGSGEAEEGGLSKMLYAALPWQLRAREAGSLLEKNDACCWVCCAAEEWWLVWLLAL